MENVIICHHGILGQKWGVRRYQNSDGTLTAEGKKRYSKDAEEYAALKRKNFKELSNEEIKKMNTRTNLINTTKAQNSLVGKYLTTSSVMHTLVKDITTVSSIASAFIAWYAAKKIKGR